MVYQIEFTEEAERHLLSFRAHDRQIIVDAVKDHLTHQPTTPTRRRKRMKENILAKWELRVGEFRVFYNVEDERVTVVVVAIGTKDHDRLVIDGEEYTL